ncbi:FecCD family ABC transporter permease [Tritonibacter mobilis]|uniref:FecCD family ABC transporter permease n=1 Tax=Tritonibacter mobilis TaxID=379347 RepID=UPI0015588B5E|nr:iron ABC transporter permease [Tritonibacter mobilis]
MRGSISRSKLSISLQGSLCLTVLGLGVIASLSFGARDVPAAVVWQALFHFDASDPLHALVRGLRLQRALTAAACGAALAIAGVLMQSLTRNPLADPGLMGVNAGAALSVVLLTWSLGPQPTTILTLTASFGAGIAALTVWLLAGGTKSTVGRDLSIRLPLAGTAISSLCLSLVAAIVLLQTESRELYRFWMVGALGQTDFETLTFVLPFLLFGIGLAALCYRGLNAMALGGDIASGLGVHPALVATLALISITLLSGGAVALAGPIGFVGLVIPHIARAIPGASLGTTLAFAGPMGAILVLGCDTIGRIAARPSEVPIGLVLALIGGPAYMIVLAKILGKRS